MAYRPGGAARVSPELLLLLGALVGLAFVVGVVLGMGYGLRQAYHADTRRRAAEDALNKLTTGL